MGGVIVECVWLVLVGLRPKPRERQERARFSIFLSRGEYPVSELIGKQNPIPVINLLF